jgi:hypothetical protein
VTRLPWIIILLGCLPLVGGAPAADSGARGTFEIALPAAVLVRTATAVPVGAGSELLGSVNGSAVRFAQVPAQTRYEVVLTLADGRILRGVDLGWYAPIRPGAATAEPLDDEARAEVRRLFDGIQAFENKRNLLALEGNHDRAVVLAELIRDTEFHSSTGGEIIWRVEVWYFENQHGGWARVSQQNRVLCRERFRTAAEYEGTAGKYRWVPELGGLAVDAGQTLRVEVRDFP